MQALATDGNVTYLPGDHRTTWMVRFGLLPFDRSRDYTRQELREHTRAFQKWQRTRSGPMGGYRAFRLYREMDLWPRIPSADLFWSYDELRNCSD
jgi:hypothetical protein